MINQRQFEALNTAQQLFKIYEESGGGAGTTLGSIDTSLNAIEGAMSGQGSSVSATVTRPANATPYTAGDVLGAAAAAITFPNLAQLGKSIIITGTSLRIDVAAVPAAMGEFVLHLYDVTPPSALADNAPWDLSAGDRASYLGYVTLGVPVDLGGTLFVQTPEVNTQFKLAGTDLFGYIRTAAGFTPAGNSEVYTPKIKFIIA